MTAANPTLASEDLPRDELLEQSKFRVRSACGPIDAVLAGGLASASVTCISGDRDDAGAKSTVRAPLLKDWHRAFG
jgi:predicted ATP-dependent serine protease